MNSKFQVEKLETWFDPLDMFRQIAPNGIGNKEVVGTDEMKNPGIEHVTDNEEDLVKKLEEEPGNAIVSEEGSVEAKEAHEEMSMIMPAECPFMNAE